MLRRSLHEEGHEETNFSRKIRLFVKYSWTDYLRTKIVERVIAKLYDMKIKLEKIYARTETARRNRRFWLFR